MCVCEERIGGGRKEAESARARERDREGDGGGWGGRERLKREEREGGVVKESELEFLMQSRGANERSRKTKNH